jgi:hypothetical protein
MKLTIPVYRCFFALSMLCSLPLSAIENSFSPNNNCNNLNECDLNFALSLLQPETALEQQIISSQEWIEGASWGEPRPGHPEGAVIFHILEVLDNVDKFYGNSPLREKLRIISIIHDTFMYKVDITVPKDGENHHAMIARRFAEKFIEDVAILDIIQTHDDAYGAWNKGKREGDWVKALELAHQLIADLGPNLELYLSFYQCDNFTGDKTAEPYEWFKEIATEVLLLP